MLRADGRRLIASALGSADPDGDSQASPFLWLADTWWFALCDRVTSSELAGLAAARVEQGFNVVHVVAGLLPEAEAFDPLGALAGRWPWTEEFGDLDPAWWAVVDERVQLLVAARLVPAVVAAWGYSLSDLGRDRMIRHCREIIARWGAFPVVFCVAGEVGLPHYEVVGRADLAELSQALADGWRDVVRAHRRLDGYRNVTTVHPWPVHGMSSATALGSTEDLDLVWLQTGHLDRSAVDPSLSTLTTELAASHGRPVLNSEVCYEGIAAGSREELQRMLFFAHVLSGAAGHSYGAQGLWAFRRAEDPGPGLRWGETAWQEAAELRGGRQLGAAATMLRGLDWSSLVPRPSSVDQHSGPEHWCRLYVAMSEDTIVGYVPPLSLLEAGVSLGRIAVAGVRPGEWDVELWNPRSSCTSEQFRLTVDADGELVLGGEDKPSLPTIEDWVIVARWRWSALEGPAAT